MKVPQAIVAQKLGLAPLVLCLIHTWMAAEIANVSALLYVVIKTYYLHHNGNYPCLAVKQHKVIY